jgi:hypothetical protein
MKRSQNQARSDAGRAPQTRTCAIATFVRHELAGGQVAVLELERRARRAGLLGEVQRIPQTKAFRTAKTDLGIESIRIGFGRGGEWAWKLGAPKALAPKADGHLREEPNPSVIQAEPEPAIIRGDANPRAELGAKLSRVAPFVEIGGIPRQWSEDVERLRVQARPRQVAPHLWHQFVQDSFSFMHSAENWAGRAASLGWDQLSLFGCSRQRPVLDLGRAGLLWVLRGGQILRLYRDWAEYLQADRSHTYHRRRVDPAQVTLPWCLR